MQRKPVYNTRQNQPQCNLGKYLGGYNIFGRCQSKLLFISRVEIIAAEIIPKWQFGYITNNKFLSLDLQCA